MTILTLLVLLWEGPLSAQVRVQTSGSLTGTVADKAIVFYSDWSTATGTGTNAVMDGGKWRQRWNPGGAPTVVTAASSPGRGWPAGLANVFRWSAPTDAGWVFFQPSDNVLPAAAVGTSRFYRYNVALFDIDYPAGQNTHGVFDGINGMAFNGVAGVSTEFHHTANGYYVLFNDADDGLSGFGPASGELSYGTVYRIEWGYLVVSDTTYRLHVRITNEATGALVYSTSSYRAPAPLGAMASALATWGGGKTRDVTRGFHFGINGYDGGRPGPYVEYGAFAICDGDWCGRYPITGVER